MSVRKHAAWMALVDDRLLEYLAGRETSRPNEIQQALASHGDATSYSQTEIDSRLDLLDTAGLVDQSSEGWSYRLTQRGALYLRGEFNAAVISVERPAAQPNQANQPDLVDRVE